MSCEEEPSVFFSYTTTTLTTPTTTSSFMEESHSTPQGSVWTQTTAGLVFQLHFHHGWSSTEVTTHSHNIKESRSVPTR
jgi:hypothetical protein